MRADLGACSDLLARLGHPDGAFRSVHVTGTKGKGTVCALVEAGLEAAGWRVGRYASPHVQRIHERISIDLRPVEDAALGTALELALDAYQRACGDVSAASRATWFDIVTAAAYVCFARAGVDWAAVEVGLGGRLDSTNVIQPDACVITNVGLEHTEVLGNTVEEIAREKAGIIKPGIPVITALAPESAAGRVVAEVAARSKAPLRFVRTARDATIGERNVATARAVLDVLGERGVMSRSFSEQAGRAVLWFDQRDVAGILDMVRELGRLVQANKAARLLIAQLEAAREAVALAAQRLPWHPRVYFEEWDEPMICGIGWVSELIATAGGIDVFSERARAPGARDRIVGNEDVLAADPQLVVGSWCGKRFSDDRVRGRPGWTELSAALVEIKSADILSPGPAAIERGLPRMLAAVADRVGTPVASLGLPPQWLTFLDQQRTLGVAA